MTVSWEEWVSCKNNIPLFVIFSLNYSIVLVRFFDELSPLTLLDKKFKEFAKLRALRAKNVLVCQRALRAYVLTCQRALRDYVLTY